MYGCAIYIVAIFGLVEFILFLADEFGIDNKLTPIYSILISIYVIIAYKLWIRRQYWMSFIWKTMSAGKNEQERIEYVGHYCLDKLTNKVIEKALVSTKKRRFIVCL